MSCPLQLDPEPEQSADLQDPETESIKEDAHSNLTRKNFLENYFKMVIWKKSSSTQLITEYT